VISGDSIDAQFEKRYLIKPKLVLKIVSNKKMFSLEGRGIYEKI